MSSLDLDVNNFSPDLQIELGRELEVFKPSVVGLADLKERYLGLVIDDVDNKEAYKFVDEGRKVVAKKRNAIDKKRKELTADALTLQRTINKEAKSIIDELLNIENHLKDQLKKVDDTHAERKLAKEREEQERYDYRVKRLASLNFSFDGVRFKSPFLDTFINEPLVIAVLTLKQMAEETFNDFYDNAAHFFEMDKQRKADEEADRKAAEQRLADEKAALEKQRQEQIAREKDIAEREAKIAEAEKERLAKFNAERRQLSTNPHEVSDETKEIINTFTPEVTRNAITDRPFHVSKFPIPNEVLSAPPPNLSQTEKKVLGAVQFKIHIDFIVEDLVEYFSQSKILLNDEEFDCVIRMAQRFQKDPRGSLFSDLKDSIINRRLIFKGEKPNA